MAVMKSKNGNDLVVDCNCGCGNGIRIRVDKDDVTDDYFLVSYITDNFNSASGDKIRYLILRKIKKIVSIIKNRDYLHSDVCMTKEEFEEFRDYINSIE